MIDRDDITGVILCGGDARRMGGVEKPLQLLHDVPLVQHVRVRLSPQVSAIVISANRSRDAYAQWGDAVVADDSLGVGPLGGLVSAWSHAHTDYVVCCPGDAPLLDGTLVARLANAMGDADICVPHDGTRAQHLFMLLRTTERAPLCAYLERGGRSVHGWLAERRVAHAHASDIADTFLNVNTEQDLLLASYACSQHHTQHHTPHVSEHL